MLHPARSPTPAIAKIRFAILIRATTAVGPAAAVETTTVEFQSSWTAAGLLVLSKLRASWAVAAAVAGVLAVPDGGVDAAQAPGVEHEGKDAMVVGFGHRAQPLRLALQNVVYCAVAVQSSSRTRSHGNLGAVAHYPSLNQDRIVGLRYFACELVAVASAWAYRRFQD